MFCAKSLYKVMKAAARCISAAVDLMKTPTLRRRHRIKLLLKQFESRSLLKEKFVKNEN